MATERGAFQKNLFAIVIDNVPSRDTQKAVGVA
jgi:hypothetical protein